MRRPTTCPIADRTVLYLISGRGSGARVGILLIMDGRNAKDCSGPQLGNEVAGRASIDFTLGRMQASDG